MIIINATGTTTITISGEFEPNDEYRLYLGDVSFDLTDISAFSGRYCTLVVPQVPSNLLDGKYELYRLIDSEIEDYITKGLFRINKSYTPSTSTFEDDSTNNIIFEE